MNRLEPTLDAAGRAAWLRSVRQLDSATSLYELLGRCRLTVEERLELACVDVFARNVAASGAVVEEYLQMFPDLASNDEYVLDLIDAEICTKRKHNLPIDGPSYTKRFPQLANRLQALVAVDEIEHSLSDPTDFSIDGSFADATPPTGAATQGMAPAHDWSMYCRVKLPEDIRLTGLIAMREDVVCLRGQSDDQSAVLVKVVARRRLGDSASTEAIGDALESLSKLKHPAWVRADVIAEDRTHVAMVRPYINGLTLLDRWDTNRSNPVEPPLRQLAELGYALAAAHDTGLVHGAVHPNNVFRDQQAQLRIVDASFGFPDRSTQWAWHASESPLADALTPRVDVQAYAQIVAVFLQRFCATTEDIAAVNEQDLIALMEWSATVADARSSLLSSVGAAVLADQLLAVADGRAVKLPGKSPKAMLSSWFRRK